MAAKSIMRRRRGGSTGRTGPGRTGSGFQMATDSQPPRDALPSRQQPLIVSRPPNHQFDLVDNEADLSDSIARMETRLERMEREMEKRFKMEEEHMERQWEKNDAPADARWSDKQLTSANPSDIFLLPAVKDLGGGRKLVELHVDVRGFDPEDVRIGVDGEVLAVHAESRRQARTCDRRRGGRGGGRFTDLSSTVRQFNKRYLLPGVVRADELRWLLTPGGVLRIEGIVDDRFPPGIPVGDRLTAKRPKQVTFAPE